MSLLNRKNPKIINITIDIRTDINAGIFSIKPMLIMILEITK